MRLFILAGLFILAALPLRAAGIALVIGNQNHDTLRSTPGAATLLDVAPALEAAGFDTLSGADLSTAEMRALLAEMQLRIDRDGAERVVIVLGGNFAHSRSGSWLLGTEAEGAGLAQADAEGLRLDTIMEIAARAGDSALVFVATGNNRNSFGTGMTAGLPFRLFAPQGVGVVRGNAPQIAGAVRAILRPGTVLTDIVDGNRQLSGEGTIRPLTPFLPEGFAPVARADRAAWAEAREEGTEAAYLAYLDTFPNGLNAQEARAEIERLRTTPERVEDALNLTRDERRNIQRDLTTLGFNTRGVDGIFGPGTRGAVRGWQERNELEVTGFLTRGQVQNLAAQAVRRAAEIEAEERARREAQEARDRAFWEATGAGVDEPALRAYLSRYPDGIFSELARERLAAIEREAVELAEARDRTAWNRARDRDSPAAYREYLAAYPDGLFAQQANQRLNELDPPPADPEPQPDPGPDEDERRAMAAEAALNLTPTTRRLIEQRLAASGYDPGAQDGAFDTQTRRAIARIQQDNSLPATGYVTQELVNLLIVGTFRDLFR